MEGSRSYEKEIDNWLKNLSPLTIKRFWEIVSVLQGQRELEDKGNFEIPIDLFAEISSLSPRDTEKILKGFHKRKIIRVTKRLRVGCSLTKLNSAQVSLWKPTIVEPWLSRSEDTEVRIFPQKFDYLVDKLESLVMQESKSSTKIANKLPNRREMAKEVTRLTKFCSLGKKEAKLLRILSNFEPKRTRELTNGIPTKDYKHLKGALAKKIIREGWAIKTDKGKGLNPDSFYTLARNSPAEN